MRQFEPFGHSKAPRGVANDDAIPISGVKLPPAAATSDTTPSMKPPVGGDQDYTDGRKPWDWKSRYPYEARRLMSTEAFVLIGMLLGCTHCRRSVPRFGRSAHKHWRWRSSNLGQLPGPRHLLHRVGWRRDLLDEMAIHSVAKGKWHIDRRYWRLMVPVIGAFMRAW